jgi:G:T-mismatch repair DNA endonuclease (very short patch repair protein)
MKNSEKLIQEKYNGVHPTCKCGCGEKTVYEAGKKNFGEYKRGHRARVVKNQFGDPKNPKRVEKIIATRKQKFDSGEYDHIKKHVSKSRSEEIKEKISKSSTGVSRPKPKGFGIGRKQSKSTRKKMSDSAIQRIIKTDQNHTSKLEKTFANILELLDIEYTQFFYAKDIKAFYDFYLPKNNILIEVDGDFWHCNPNTKYSTPKYQTQNKNIKRDQVKNQWAQDNNYKILRFWEDDINNNIQQIKQILLENCK